VEIGKQRREEEEKRTEEEKRRRGEEEKGRRGGWASLPSPFFLPLLVNIYILLR
jgi:hypothetical protein